MLSSTDSFFLIAGPCAIEGPEMAMDIAKQVKGICEDLSIPFIFKGSYRKANRSRLDSFTGIGDEKALNILAEIKAALNVPVTTDVHTSQEAIMAAEYVDILQIPAFLCRQTDLIVAAAKTGKIVNIKKGQFMSAAAMQHSINKVQESSASQVYLTERGFSFGYQDLVVDFRGIPVMKKMNVPVVVDCTHSLQKPNQAKGVTGGEPDMIETIARAAIAVGADGLFIETHPNPSVAKSDGANMLELSLLPALLGRLKKLDQTVRSFS